MSNEEMNKNKNSRKLVYESTNSSKSIIQIYKNEYVPLPKSMVSIPKWVLVFLGLLVALLTIVLLAAILVVLTAPRAAQYMEFCNGRSCQTGLNMKCIDKVCKCESNKYYMKGCLEKKSDGKSCAFTYECLSEKGLYCLNGKCQCNKTQYWDTNTCTSRYSYGEFCSNDQCLSTVMLSCINGICQCDSTRFWNGIGCIKKRSEGERCYNDDECIETKFLKCHSGKCECVATWEYFDNQLGHCQPKINESQTCVSTVQCLGEMQCLNQNCTCGSFSYFETYNYTCLSQALFNQSCKANVTCRGDLGLYCSLDGVCVCDSITQYWNSTMCANYLTYGQTGCTSDADCNSNQFLTCNTYLMSYSCNCPNQSLTSMCDCPRTKNNESYWNSSHCVRAKNTGDACSYDYECQTLTLSHKCDVGVCTVKCDSGWSYFNNKCYSIISNNGGCSPLNSTNYGCDETNVISKCTSVKSTSQLAIFTDVDIFYFARSIDSSQDKTLFDDSYIGGYWQGTGTSTNCDCNWSWSCSNAGGGPSSGTCNYNWVWVDGSLIDTTFATGGWDGGGFNTNNGVGSGASANIRYDFCVRTKTDSFAGNNCVDDRNFICEYSI